MDERLRLLPSLRRVRTGSSVEVELSRHGHEGTIWLMCTRTLTMVGACFSEHFVVRQAPAWVTIKSRIGRVKKCEVGRTCSIEWRNTGNEMIRRALALGSAPSERQSPPRSDPTGA
jgi:hypothetical protein